MSVQAKKRAKGLVYFAVFRWQGKQVWEHAGTDRREAERLDARRQREVKAGTYLPSGHGLTTGEWAKIWIDKRTNRSRDDDEYRIGHVVNQAWFAEMPIRDVRPKHVLRLVKELKGKVSALTHRPFAAKSVHDIFGAARTMFRDALLEEHIDANPCILPRGTTSTKLTYKRVPYEAGEVLLLTTSEKVRAERRIGNSLAFYTGARKGEVCGLTWKDWDRATRPLTCLRVDKQYDGQPLKTDDAEGDRARMIPVHPALDRALADWWRLGWEAFYGRAPTLNDFIVPRADFTAGTRNSFSYGWEVSCAEVDVPYRTVHSSRHTFISLARRGGARKDVLERITHNSKGDIVDGYTAWDWLPLCEAVLCFSVRREVDRLPQATTISETSAAANLGDSSANPEIDSVIEGNSSTSPSIDEPSNSPGLPNGAANGGALQHRCPRCGWEFEQ